MTENKVPTSGSKAVSEESLLKIAKEITVKFIEVGRVTPSSFPDDFKDIYTTIANTVRKDP